MSTATVECLYSDVKQIKAFAINFYYFISMLMITAIEGLPLTKVDFDAVVSLWKSIL